MKRILLIFAVTGLLAALAGCGGGSIPAEKLAGTLGKLKANTADTPHTVKFDNTVNISAKGDDIRDTIASEGKYVILDLSECSATDNTIDGWGNYGNEFITGIILPKSLTTIGESAFADYSNLTSVTIPGSVTSIGWMAFCRCSGLTSVTIPGSVTSIEYATFQECSGLSSVTIPGSVTSIGDFAFSGCSGLTSVTIPGSVTSIGQRAFYGCSNLTSVTFAPGSAIDSFYHSAFDYYDIALRDVYNSGGAGTYTFAAGTWTKQ